MLSKVSGTYRLPYTIKAEWTTYLTFSIVFGPIALLYLYIVITNPSSNFWQPLLLIFGVLMVLMIWIASFTIKLENDSITYKTLFSKKAPIPFVQIRRIEIQIGLDKSAHENRLKSDIPFVRLDLIQRGVDQPLVINMKPFSKRHLAIIIDAIATANPSVSLDASSQQVRYEDF